MMKVYISVIFIIAIILSQSQAEIIQVSAAKDNTIYEGWLGSNGAGDHFFAGRTGAELQGAIRRSLIKFDLSSIPVEAKITNVKLTLHMSRTNLTTDRTVALHRLSQDWGEEDSHAAGNEGGGASASVGDATWDFAFLRTVPWKSAGGDFSVTSSASQTVGNIGYYIWGSTAGMVSDVQNWISNPAQNYGWLVKGDESEWTTAKRFDSRTNPVPEYRPVLEVQYEAPDVYITEVFQFPEKEGFPGEFIEIYNTGTIEQDLRGWFLFQPNLELITTLDEKSLLSGDLILQPGEYAVIGRGSSDEFKKLWGFLPDTYFSQGNSSNAGAPQINDGAYWRLYNPFQTVVDRYGSSDTFQFSSKTNHYTRIEYPNDGTSLKHWLADTKWGNPGTDNLAPVAQNDDANVNEDNNIIINVLSNDHDLDGSLILSSVEIISNPGHGKILAVNGQTGAVTYEPDTDYFGSDLFKYIVFDDKGKASNEATVFLNIVSINDAPVAGNDSVETGEDKAITIPVLANDQDIDGKLDPTSVKLVESPTNGKTSIDTKTGNITYTPVRNYSGPDKFSYTVEDDSGAVSNTALVILSISAQNDPPVIGKLPVIEFNEDDSYKIAFTELYGYVDDPDTPKDLLAIKLTGGDHLSTDSDELNIIITAASNWFGEDTLLLEVNDGELSDKADLFVIVHSVNDVPEIKGLPEMLNLNADSTAELMLWDFVSDIETPDNKLKYGFDTSNDSLKYDFDVLTGKLTLSAIFGLNHAVSLKITVTDESAAEVMDEISVQVETISGIALNEPLQLPDRFELSQNYPNPFNPVTTIRYQLPETADVYLEIFNPLGQRVAVLVSGKQPAGSYLVTFNTMNYQLASGIYIYHLRAGKYMQTRKMVLMR